MDDRETTAAVQEVAGMTQTTAAVQEVAGMTQTTAAVQDIAGNPDDRDDRKSR
jgi:hypothetical protein